MTYKNPVISIKNTDHGDPAVLKYSGVYYLYHTAAKEIPVYCSNNLIDWEKVGIALKASNGPNHWAQIDLWAPEVIYENGRFYMYVTGTVMNDDGTGNDKIRRIGVATSNSPIGPFQLASEPLTDEWSIDAHPFKDEDGSYYLFYNVRNKYTRGPNGVIGTGNVVDRMTDLTTLSGNPTLVVKPEYRWEGNKEGTFYWNEGPFVVKKSGLYYQMYSAGFFGDDSYGVYYATSDTPMGSEGMKDTSWKKWRNGKPVLQTNEACFGPGHHVVVKGPNGLDDYIVYHGFEPHDMNGRKVRVGRLAWDDTNLILELPSKDKLARPVLPTFDGRFIDSVTELNDKLKKHRFFSFLFETNQSFKGENGVCTLFQLVNEIMTIDWKIDIPKKKIYATNKEQLLASYNLSNIFNTDVFHHIVLIKENYEVNLKIDDMSIITLKINARNNFINIHNGSSIGTVLTEIK